MEKIIHFTVPARLTPINIECIELARKLHPTWEIKVWQDPMRPDGYPLERYWQKANSGAQLSDLLRLDVLHRWGGVYVDGDMRLLKPLDNLADKFDFFIASHDGIVPINALIGARKGHSAIQAIIGELLLNEPDWSKPADKTTGPDIFVRTLKWDRQATFLPRETFYSYGPTEILARKNHRHAYAEHLWEYSWRDPTKPRIPSRTLKSITKRFIIEAIVGSFRNWHRIKSLDPKFPQPATPKNRYFYAAADEIVVKTFEGLNLFVDRNSPQAATTTFGDRDEFGADLFLKMILRGGDWAILVDSKDALFSMLAAQRVGSFGRVYVYLSNKRALQLLSKSANANRMHDRLILRLIPTDEAEHDESSATIGDSAATPDIPLALADDFPVDLPIKVLRIDAEAYDTAILERARRLIEHRCIDFISIRLTVDPVWPTRWRREVGGRRWNGLYNQLTLLTACGYVACNVTKDGELIQRESITSALDSMEGRDIVFAAADQYISGYEDSTGDKRHA
jgi:hypothetical protein